MATFFGEVLPVISRAIEDDDDDDELDFVETYRNIITNHRDFLPVTFFFNCRCQLKNYKYFEVGNKSTWSFTHCMTRICKI